MKVRSKTMKAGILALLLLGPPDAWTQTPMQLMPGMIDGWNRPIDMDTGEKVFLLTPGPATSPPGGGSVVRVGFTVSGSDPPPSWCSTPDRTLLLNQGDNVRDRPDQQAARECLHGVPGQSGVVATELLAPTRTACWPRGQPLSGGRQPGGCGRQVRYTLPSGAGHLLYHSGTGAGPAGGHGPVRGHHRRPANFNVAIAENRKAYNHDGPAMTWSTCSWKSEIDPRSPQVQYGWWNQVDTAAFFPDLLLLNGRAAPDTMYRPYAAWLPTQAYNCMPMMERGRTADAGSTRAGTCTLHQHGNHAQVIAGTLASWT